MPEFLFVSVDKFYWVFQIKEDTEKTALISYCIKCDDYWISDEVNGNVFYVIFVICVYWHIYKFFSSYMQDDF